MTDQHITRKRRIPPLYHGWLVVAAAFLFALYGFGLGFYGPGVYLAASIVDHYPNIEIPIPLQRIAYAVGIVEMIPQTTSSFEGVLVTDDAKSTGSIAYNEASGVERRRFTIAHEIGHFLIPWHGAKSRSTKLLNRRNRL
jgi:hypothetical protein